MDIELYNERMKKIEADFKSAKQSLYIEYAKSQEIYKIGDIINDGAKVIKIDKITASMDFNKPYPVYHGFELKKDLTPKKNNIRDSIYGNHGTSLVKKSESADIGKAVLIRGVDLTENQKSLLTFNGMENPEWVKNHSFWFKDGKPATEEGFIYPVGHSLSHLPH